MVGMVTFLQITSAQAGDVRILLLGTTESPVTRMITIGPDVFDCLFCTTIPVVDVNLTDGISDHIQLPGSGGTVHVFVYVEVLDESAGVKSFVFNVLSNIPGPTFHPTHFDIVFEDTAGRTASFFGMASSIPPERPVAGKLTVGDEAWFFQTLANRFQAFPGSPGPAHYDMAAGCDTLAPQVDAHTMGLGVLGNDQTQGPTAVARFSVDVPPLPAPRKSTTYELSLDAQSIITYVARPALGKPFPPSEFGIQEGVVINNLPLTVTVGAPSSVFGDCDDDNDIDLVDFGAFQICFTGSNPQKPLTKMCNCADSDADGDVDLIDFGAFQLAFGTTPSSPPAVASPARTLSSRLAETNDDSGALDEPEGPILGDCDNDGDLDMADYAVLELCFTTSDAGPVKPQCHCIDFDSDNDVDLDDRDQFLKDFTGPIPPDLP
jgi:hypothetical protein